MIDSTRDGANGVIEVRGGTRMKDIDKVAQVRESVIGALEGCLKSLDSIGDKVAAIFVQNAIDDLRDRGESHQNGPNFDER